MSKSNRNSIESADTKFESNSITREVHEIVNRLADDGQVDGYGGGVALSDVCEHVEYCSVTVSKHLSYLVDRGDLKRVRGIGPSGVRDSYMPAEMVDSGVGERSWGGVCE